MRNIAKTNKGAVSLFVVIFTMMLLTVVTMSFARLMLREQQQARDNDLSQSAYDSALAGVEDAKRALASDYSGVNLSACNAIAAVLGDDDSGGEVRVGADEMNQAYTCVKVKTETSDYLGSVGADQTRVIPLRSTNEFSRLTIEWFSKEDVALSSGGGDSTKVDVPAVTGSKSQLPKNWSPSRPPVLEAQLIQTSDKFRIQDFDTSDKNKTNSSTLFLFPLQLISKPNISFMSDKREPVSGNGLTDVRCVPSLQSTEYSCRAEISVPAPRDGAAASRQNAFLRIVPRYNGTHFRISLQNNDGDMVLFDGVQPEVDSTGRASDLFRRVSARVETNNAATYPNAAVDVSGDFCKLFRVTNSASDYEAYADRCRP